MHEWVVGKNVSREGISLAEEILLGRGFSERELNHFIKPDYEADLPDPFLLPDVGAAVNRISRARQKGEKVAIYGDYDIDGITAATLLNNVLNVMGLNATIYVPDRFEEGYGINKDALLKLKETGTGLVITVDCGITAAAEIKAAQKAGLDVIVTDHHEITGELPRQAIAVINPKRTDSSYPSRNLAGVGVAFTLVRALQIKFPDLIKPGQEKWLLDLVALGTICDAVPLTGENRLLSKYGLRVLKITRNLGLKQLMRVARVEPSEVTGSDIGFRLGPRLNAAGRIEHANLSVRLLNSKNLNEVAEIADRLERLNAKRQFATEATCESASQMAKAFEKDEVLILADPAWSHGVAGIVAARVSEKYKKPTIIMQTEGNISKGSARSVGEFSMINALRRADDVIEKYGGHDFAAGLTIKTKKIDKLRQLLNDYAKENPINYQPKLEIDLDIPFSMINLESLADIEQLTPFGQDNKQPIFTSKLRLEYAKPVGQKLDHLRLVFSSNSGNIVGVAFSHNNRWPWIYDQLGSLVQIAYYMVKNNWQQRASCQIEVIDIKKI